ncbi:hypothetical protein PIB30_111308, partial [Stylosanthes scabra]|nr:hypothetical protein [Stylosanthes scabra]
EILRFCRRSPRICVSSHAYAWTATHNVEWEELAHVIRESSRITWALCLVPHVYTLYVAPPRITCTLWNSCGFSENCLVFHAYAWTSTPMRGSSFWPCRFSYSSMFSTHILGLQRVYVVHGACMMILASHVYAWTSTPMRGSCEVGSYA